jgi:hypothetical protein
VEADELLRIAVEACDRLGITYLVTGSTASIAYGEPRFTNDIDILVDLPADLVDAFCDAFPEDEFYLNRQTVRTCVRDAFQFNLIHPASGLKIDFIVLTRSEYDRSRVQRRRLLPALADQDVCFASPEDVIVKKMLYYREGESPKHIRDIGGIIRVQGAKLDRAYIAEWARRLGVDGIWLQIVERESASDESA